MAKFITNQKEFLSEIINKILPSSEKLFFLVGYFYFSGFEQIYQNIVDKKIKILIGMDIEKDLSNKIKEFTIIQEINQSRLEIKKNYYHSFVEIFNDTDFFDSEEKQKAFRIFLNKIKDGTLEIKKTQTPNHSKLYLFQYKPEHNQGGLMPGALITGSSNLTKLGLKTQQEINVILWDEYEKGKKIFDNLWNSAIDIVTKDTIDEYFVEVIEKIWIDKLYAPFLFYLRVLHEYFSIENTTELKMPAEITNSNFFNLKYQIDAIKRAINILERHNGVIISDVVGLGKSIIASAIAYNLRKKVIIIAPPHLYYQWDKIYRTSFDMNAVVFGSNSIDKALYHLYNVWNNEEILIIVDEAHKYRNENTENYINLHRLCQGNKVILLTATPFNNRPQDIFAMIKLFQLPSKSTIRTIDNLSYQFQQMIKEYKDIQKSRRNKTEDENILKQRIKNLAKKIRNILEPVLIRRSRIDLKKIDDYRNDLDSQNISLPEVAPPKLQEYELGDLANLYLTTLEKICSEDRRTGFIGARYNPANYLKNFNAFKAKMKNQIDDIDSIRIAQTNLAIFMRRLLVGRFESSVQAFKSTLHSMILSMETIKDYYERLSKIPIYKKGMLPDVDILLQNYDDEDIEDLNELSFEKELKSYYDKGLIFINRDEIKNEFIIDLNHDIELLKSIENEWFENGIKKDPKLEHFIKEIKTQISKEPKRKIVVFSQYKDTVNYLYKNVKRDLRAISYSSESSDKVKRIIRENFDTTNKVQKNDYDIIIATDALSEGVNLNKAGIVFNYDIPYNPTRVIQRVGRINRISKKVFDKLYIYNYFPTHIGEAETRTREIATLKKAMIDALLGEDTKYLTSDEELQSYFTKKYKEEMELYEQKSWDVEYRNFYLNLRKSKPELIEKAKEIPHRARIRRSVKKDKTGVLVFGKKGNDYTFKLGVDKDNALSLTVPDAINLFKAKISEKPRKITSNFENLYQRAKAKMFITKTQIKLSGRKGQAIHKIEILKELFPDKKDYFIDLYFVAKELDALPEGVYKQIRNIDKKTLKQDVDNLIRIVPHSYLSKIIQTANKIDEGKETLILAEELI